MSQEIYNTPDFSVALPAGWTRKVVASFIDPTPDRQFQQSLVLTQDVLAEPTTLETFVTQQKESLEGLPGFEKAEELSLQTATQNVPVVCFTWTPSKEQTLKQFQAYFLKPPGTTWILTGTAAPEEADVFFLVFQQAVQSFQFSVPAVPAPAGS